MNKNDKMKRMKNITLGAIAGYLVGVFTPVAWMGAGISMVSGIILFAMFWALLLQMSLSVKLL